MIDFLRWLIAIEVISIAFLPLTVWALRALPDRGYVFARVLGLVLMTYATWLIGSFLPVAGPAILPALTVVVSAGAGWWLWHRETLEAIREVRRAVVVEEALFVAALTAWALLRVYTLGAAVAHTEQFMDMTFLNASYASASYPPFDPWMSGHSINYYYFGYLLFATLAKVSFVAPSVAFNLANCTLFATAVGGAYAIGYALCRRLHWALVFPVLFALIGNWHAILWQAWHSSCAPSGATTFWYSWWQSTRVIGAGYTLQGWSGCGNGNQPTITEYPMFSFVLGDLHPHVMALPVALVAVALGIGVLFAEHPPALRPHASVVGRSLLLSMVVGSLFAINSWDFPTYLVVVGACILAAAYISDNSRLWWRRPLVHFGAIAVISVTLYAPFYIHLHPPTGGIGRVTGGSDVFEFLQVFGPLLIPAVLLVAVLAVLLQPAEEAGDVPAPAAAESGDSRSDLMIWMLSVAAVGVVAFVAHRVVLAALLVLAAGALLVLNRVLNTEEPNRGDAAALVLALVGFLVVALPEVIYLRDSFDGSTMYRMNTVFKFYYQGWTLLALAGGYGVWRGWDVLRLYFKRAYARIALAAVAAGVLTGSVYTLWLPSTSVAETTGHSLDGSAWIAADHPADFAAIAWLQHRAAGHPTILEAIGPDYQYSSPISTFTGLPTVMGWVGHEQQWHGNLPEIETRAADVATIYRTANVATARRLIRKYDVRYVIVGPEEENTYSASGHLNKFGRFMRVAYQSHDITIYAR